jgi:hypothetical protein
MRHLLGASLLVGFLLSAAATPPALAMTCTERQQTCFAFCEKNRHNSPQCRGVCAGLLDTCMSTGCWESRITAKRCGISKQ